MTYIGHLSILTTLKGGVAIPVANGNVYGYCLSEADLTALESLTAGVAQTDFTRADGSVGKCLNAGIVRVDLEQVAELGDGTPVWRFVTPPERAEDVASKRLFK